MIQPNETLNYISVLRRGVGFLSVIIAVMAISGCSEEKTIVPSSETTYYTDVKYIFDLKCATNGCHAGAEPAADLGMETYDQILAGSIHGSIAEPGNSESSSLYRTMAWTIQPVMPVDEKLPQPLIDAVAKWIDDGMFESR
jgi:hypothetical protein